MKHNFCFFMVLLFLSSPAMAEYYLIYHPRPCDSCRNACGQPEACSNSGSHAISTAQSEFYGEYCTTYDDVQQGQYP